MDNIISNQSKLGHGSKYDKSPSFAKQWMSKLKSWNFYKAQDGLDFSFSFLNHILNFAL